MAPAADNRTMILSFPKLPGVDAEERRRLASAGRLGPAARPEGPGEEVLDGTP